MCPLTSFGRSAVDVALVSSHMRSIAVLETRLGQGSGADTHPRLFLACTLESSPLLSVSERRASSRMFRWPNVNE
jgi:hypothetical protein